MILSHVSQLYHNYDLSMYKLSDGALHRFVMFNECCKVYHGPYHAVFTYNTWREVSQCGFACAEIMML